MSDEGMNPCECIWGHEMAMRRLLSLLRQTQNVCTDTECFDGPTGQLSQQSTPDDNFMMMSIMLMFAIALYMLRPRAITAGNDKPQNSDNGSNGTPPSAPPPSSF